MRSQIHGGICDGSRRRVSDLYMETGATTTNARSRVARRNTEVLGDSWKPRVPKELVERIGQVIEKQKNETTSLPWPSEPRLPS